MIKYYSKQGEKIVVLVRMMILMSKFGFEDEFLNTNTSSTYMY
jgi:hypothetical protein